MIFPLKNLRHIHSIFILPPLHISRNTLQKIPGDLVTRYWVSCGWQRDTDVDAASAGHIWDQSQEASVKRSYFYEIEEVDSFSMGSWKTLRLFYFFFERRTFQERHACFTLIEIPKSKDIQFWNSTKDLGEKSHERLWILFWKTCENAAHSRVGRGRGLGTHSHSLTRLTHILLIRWTLFLYFFGQTAYFSLQDKHSLALIITSASTLAFIQKHWNLTLVKIKL